MNKGRYIKVAENNTKTAQLSKKQLRDAKKKKARTKKKILTVLISVVAVALVVAIIGTAAFFSTYDPLKDNIKASVKAVFTLPYAEKGSEDLTTKTPMFPLDQAAYFYFLNNYSDIMTDNCCLEIRKSVEYWDGWNKQTDYTITPNEFAYQKRGDTNAYFETILDIRDKDGTLVDFVTMAGVVSYDPATNLIDDINLDSKAIVTLADAYEKYVLGIEPETEETAE